MPTSNEPVVDCLGEFVKVVRDFRQSWGLPKHRELWFRGEGRDHGDTILRPELYRPASADVMLDQTTGQPVKDEAMELSLVELGRRITETQTAGAKK